MANVKKISVSFTEELMERMDKYAAAHGMTRSGLLSVAVESYINATEQMPSINKVIGLMGKMATNMMNGTIDQMTAKTEIDDIEQQTNQVAQKIVSQEEIDRLKKILED